MCPAVSRGRLLVLALTLSVAVAGCGGLSQEEPETVTPAPVPDDDSRPPVDGDLVAPGVTAERIVDAGALTDAHAQQLTANSHTVREEVTRASSNGSVRAERTTVVRRNGSVVRYQRTSRSSESDTVQRIDRWSEGSRTYTARTGPNGTTYTVLNASGDDGTVASADYARSLGRVLGLLPVEVAGQTERDGVTYYRLEAAEVRDRPPLSNVSFVGYVRPDGLVTEYTVTYTTDIGTESVDVTVQVTVEDIGTTTVDRPAWYEEAQNATDDPQ